MQSKGRIGYAPWCKRARIKMILLGIETKDLCEKTGKTRAYLTSILNGRNFSEKGVKLLSNTLGITDDYYDDSGLDVISTLL